MAITPLTKPVQMGEFIPQQPRLPVDDIASATQNVYEQELAAKQRRNKLFDAVAQQKAAKADRPALQSIEQRLNQEFENLAQDDDLLFNDRERISQLARFAEEELGKVERARKIRQKQQEIIEENIQGEARQRQFKNYFQSPRIETTEDGRIDPDSLPSVVEFGEETGNLREVGAEAIDNLKSRFAGRYPSVNEDMKLAEMVEKSGVGKERIKKTVIDEYRNNPKVQNWMDNTRRQRERELMAKGISRDKAIDRASRYAQSRLKEEAEAVATNRWSQEVNFDQISGFFDNQSGSNGSQVLTFRGSPISEDQHPKGTAGRKEFADRRRAIRKYVMQEEFTQEELDKIRKYRRDAEAFGKTGGQREVQRELDVSGGMGSAVIPRVVNQTNPDSRFAQKMRDAGLWKEYRTIQDRVEDKIKSPEYAPNFLVPTGMTNREVETVAQTLIPMANKIKAEDVKVQTETNDWIPFSGTSEADVNKNLRKVFGNTERIAVSDDGRFLNITTSSNIDEEAGKLENRSFRIPTYSLTQSQIGKLADQMPEDISKTLKANAAYRNIAITTDDPLEISDSIRVEKNAEVGENTYSENYTVQKKTEDGYRSVNYSDVISRTDDINTAIREIQTAARDLGYKALDSPEDIKEAYRSYKTHQESGTKLSPSAEQLRQLLQSSVRLQHRGSAIEFGKRLSQ